MSTSYPGDRGRPTDNVRERAERIAEDLLYGHPPDPEASGQVPLADVEEDVADFTGQAQLMDELGMAMPAVELVAGELEADAFEVISTPADLLPVSVDLIADRQIAGSDRGEFRDRLLTAYELAERSDSTFKPVPTWEARQHFQRRLTDFLSIRIRASGDGQGATGWPGAVLLWLPLRRDRPPTTVPGCLFEVTTNSPGLRAHWSGAYFLKANYFGQTTPAQGTLQSGAYFFGVDGGAYKNKIRWDRNTTVTLPGTPRVHLNY